MTGQNFSVHMFYQAQTKITPTFFAVGFMFEECHKGVVSCVIIIIIETSFLSRINLKYETTRLLHHLSSCTVKQACWGAQVWTIGIHVFRPRNYESRCCVVRLWWRICLKCSRQKEQKRPQNWSLWYTVFDLTVWEVNSPRETYPVIPACCLSLIIRMVWSMQYMGMSSNSEFTWVGCHRLIIYNSKKSWFFATQLTKPRLKVKNKTKTLMKYLPKFVPKFII